VGQLLDCLRPTDAFDPDALEKLGTAYDLAVAALDDIGQPTVVREAIAQRIIRAAQKGERDPAELCSMALVALNSDKLTR
jgi:hypothetical protein